MQIKNLSKADYYKSRNIVVPKITHKLPKQPNPPFNLNLSMPEMAQEIHRYLARRILMEKNEIARMALEPSYHKLGIDVQDLKKVIANREDEITILKSQREKDFRKIETLEAKVFELHQQLHKVEFEYKNYIEALMSQNKTQLKLHTDKITYLEEENRKISADYNHLMISTREKYQLKSNTQLNASLDSYSQELFEQYRKEIESLKVEKELFRQKAISNQIDVDKKTKSLENDLIMMKAHLDKVEKDLELQILKNDTINNQKDTEILNLVQQIAELKKHNNTEKQALIDQLKQYQTYKFESQKRFHDTVEKDRLLIEGYIKRISSLDSQIIKLKGVIDQGERKIQEMESNLLSMEFEKQEKEMNSQIEIDRMSQSKSASIREEVQIARRTYEEVISKLELELREVKSQNLKKNQKIQRLNEEITQKETHFKQYKQTERSQKIESDVLKENNEKLKRQCENLKEAIQALKRIHDTEKKELQLKIQQRKTSQLEKTSIETEQKAVEIIELKNQLQKNRKLHESEVNTLNKQLTFKAKDIEILKKEMNAINKQKEDIKTKYTILQMDYESYKTQYDRQIGRYKKIDKEKNEEITRNQEEYYSLKKQNDQLREMLQKEKNRLHELQRFQKQDEQKHESRRCIKCIMKDMKLKVFEDSVKDLKLQNLAKIKVSNINELQQLVDLQFRAWINTEFQYALNQNLQLLQTFENEVEEKSETISLLQKNNVVLTEKNKHLSQALIAVKSLHHKQVEKQVKKNYRYANIEVDEQDCEKSKSKPSIQKPAQNSKQNQNRIIPNMHSDHIKIQDVASSQSSHGLSQCVSEYADSEELRKEMSKMKMEKNRSVKELSLGVSSSVKTANFNIQTISKTSSRQQKVQKKAQTQSEKNDEPVYSILDQISLAFSEYEKSGLFQKPIFEENKPKKLESNKSSSSGIVLSEGSDTVIQQLPRQKSVKRIAIEKIFKNTESFLEGTRWQNDIKNQKLQKQDQKFQVIKKQYEEFKSEHRNCKERLQELEKKRKQSNDDIGKINTKLEKCLKSLDPQASKKEGQQMEILKCQVDKVIQAAQTLQEELEQTNYKNQSLKKSLDEKIMAVEDHLYTIQRMEMTLKNFESKKEKMREEMIEEMSKMKQQYQEEVTKKKNSFSSLQKEIEQKNNQMTNLKVELQLAETKFKNQEEFSQQKLNLKSQQIQELNEKVEKVNIKYAELENQLTLTRSKLNEAGIHIINSKEEIIKIKKQFKEETEKFIKDTQDLKNRLAQQTLRCKQNDGYKKQIQLLKQATKKLEQKNRNLNNKLDQKQKQHDQNIQEKDKRWEDHIKILKINHEKSIDDLKTEIQSLYQKIEKITLQHQTEIKTHIEKYDKYRQEKWIERTQFKRKIETLQKDNATLIQKSDKDERAKELLLKFKVRWQNFCQQIVQKREVVTPEEEDEIDKSCIMYKSKLDQTQNQGSQTNLLNIKCSRILSKDITELYDAKEVKLETHKKESIFVSQQNEMERTVRHELKVQKFESQKDEHQIEVSYIKEEDSELLQSGTEEIQEFDASQEECSQRTPEQKEEK